MLKVVCAHCHEWFAPKTDWAKRIVELCPHCDQGNLQVYEDTDDGEGQIVCEKHEKWPDYKGMDDWRSGSSMLRHSDFNLDTQRWERWRPPLPEWATIIDCGAWTE